MASNIFDYITEQESLYKTMRVPIADGYEWNMYEHIRKTTLYKNSKFTTGSDDGSRPYKNIILPIAKLAYRAEGFDVKDIELFINNKDEYYKSFLARKYHENWALTKQIDAFIDTIVTTAFDYGGVLVKKTKNNVEVVPFQRIAFCDQTNIMGGVIGEKHAYAIEELEEMRGVWKDEAIDELIANAISQTVSYGNSIGVQTTSKTIEVYEVNGMFPVEWLGDEDGKENYDDSKKYSRQLHLVSFIKGTDNAKKGITLFTGKLSKSPFKFMGRGGEAETIFGRALNRGGIEELFEPQIWVNYSIIQMKEMLDTASLMILQTTDASLGTKNIIKDLSQGEIITTAPNTSLTQVNYQPINENSFKTSIAEWEAHARTTGSASEASLAIAPTSGTPFALEQLKTQNGLAEHEYQRGIIAGFVNELYRDWIIAMMVKDMLAGKTWLEELSLSELIKVSENVIDNELIDNLKSKLFSGVAMTQEQADQFKVLARDNFKKSKTKFLEILKGEMKGLPMDIYVNVAGKQKYQSDLVNKLGNVFKTVLSNPQVLQIPQMASLFNQIIENSGLSPIDFDTMPAQATQEQITAVETTEAPVAQV